MTPARLAFYSMLLVGAAGIGAVLFVLLLVQTVGPFSAANAPVAMAAVALLVLVAISFLTSWLFRWNVARNRITLATQDGHARNFTNGVALGFVFGAVWRVVAVGIVTGAATAFLKSAYGTEISAVRTGAIDLFAFAANWFLAFWWVYAMPYGSYRIDFAPSTATVAETPKIVPVASTPYTSLQDSSSSLRDAIAGTLGVIAAISYYGLGLLQLAAIASFFHSIWGWWLIPSVVVAMFLAYMPIIGALSGIYAAVNAWGWSWYAAAALYFFPFLVWAAIMLLVGASAATQALFGGWRRNADI